MADTNAIETTTKPKKRQINRRKKDEAKDVGVLNYVFQYVWAVVQT